MGSWGFGGGGVRMVFRSGVFLGEEVRGVTAENQVTAESRGGCFRKRRLRFWTPRSTGSAPQHKVRMWE